MRRLDELPWKEGLAFTVWGVRLGLRTMDPTVLPAVLPLLPPGWHPAGTLRVQWLYSWASRKARRRGNPAIHTLYSGPYHMNQGSNVERLSLTLAADVQAQLALRSPWRVFVHAGVVGWRGKAIVLPGRSGVGKSTLTAALVRLGASFFSDEFAVLDHKGRVYPYPLPLRFPRKDGPGSLRVPLEELGGRSAQGPLPVGMVAVLRFLPSTGLRVHALSPGRAALELVAQAVQARIRPFAVLRAAASTSAEAVLLKGHRGEAEEAARFLLEKLDS